jgi:hypothetical protein
MIANNNLIVKCKNLYKIDLLTKFDLVIVSQHYWRREYQIYRILENLQNNLSG